jgi:glycosyltransferase involved in cell wall biosynthesis
VARPEATRTSEHAGILPLRSTRVLAIVPTDCSFEDMAVNQRLRALAEMAQLDILACYPASVPADIRCRVRGLPLSSCLASPILKKLIFSIEVTTWALWYSLFEPYQITYTFQDTSAFAGQIMRRRGSRWVIDVLDDPSLEARNAEEQRRRAKAFILRRRSRLIGRMLRKADLVVTIGRSLDDPLPTMIHRRYGVGRERLIPLTQAIRTARLINASSPDPGRSSAATIFYVGWVSALRGIDALIAATDLIRARGRDVVLRLAGTLKDDETEIRAMISDRPYISYLGILPSQVAREEMLAADVCCCPFPDREELAPVQPVKVLEYLALGRPVVASRTCGIAALIEHERSGLLAIPGSANSLAQEIERILDNDDLARQLSSGARIRAQAFDVINANSLLTQRLMRWF